MKRLIFTLAVMLAASGGIYAQETRRSVQVRFVHGRDSLVKEFSGNQANLEAMVEFLKRADTVILERITVLGSASPEGSLGLNARLAEARADILRHVLLSEYGMQELVDSPSRTVNSWKALRELVEAESSFPSKTATLTLLDEFIAHPEEDDLQHRSYLERLQALDQGAPYRFMAYLHFPAIRSACLEITYRTGERPVGSVAPSPLQEETATEADSTGGRFRFIIRTNLLYDLALVPNIAGEIHLKNNWTIIAQYHHSWWKSDKEHWYWRTYGGELAVRKYFGRAAARNLACGHHLGINGQVFTYDFETGDRGYLGKKPTWGAGIEYGYSLPVGKRLNIDFTLGAGYWQGEYMEYLPIDNCYVWQATKDRKYFGPTKADISLVWFIGKGYANRKAGKRP